MAFAKQSDPVRSALLEALCRIPLCTTDIAILRIRHALLSALKEPCGLLESCHQGKIKHRTERLFLKYGKEYAIVVLGFGTKDDDHRLFRDIDPLPDGDLINLIQSIERLPTESLYRRVPRRIC